MFEVIHLQRAMLNGATSDEGIAHSALSPDTPVRVSSTSTFVNALWFTSLALSLTTALLAVLTTHWIHQYLAISSGTPRDCCRTRQFRYENLKEWHVPLIIGMLPVLMHIALGLFFGGLVVYVRSLSPPIAIVVGAIAFFAFVAYFGTNLLPLFKPTCPYKTYLTRYSYSLLGYLQTASISFSQRWHRLYTGICSAAAPLIRSLKFKDTPDAPSQPANFEKESNKSYPELQQVTPRFTPRLLKALEKDLVAQRGHALDARALAGLHNISSNTSVQRIVLQALSILPIETVEIVRARIPNLDRIIRDLLRSQEYIATDTQSAYERLYRAHIHVWGTMDHSATENIPGVPKGFAPVIVMTPDNTPAVRCDDSIATLVTRHHPENAEKFLREQILNPTVLYDTFTWVVILQNAFGRGAGWLEFNNQESPVWMKLLAWLIRPHECLEHTVCDINQFCKDIASLPIYGGKLKLTIRDYSHHSSTKPIDFESAMTFFMRPSICECLARIFYPNLCRDVDYAELPHDIILNLALIQLSSVQSTSRDKGENVMSSSTACMQGYIGVKPGTVLDYHKAIVAATFRSLISMVNSTTFFTDVVTTPHKLRILHALIRTLLLDQKLIVPLSNQLTPLAMRAIVTVIFQDFPDPRHLLTWGLRFATSFMLRNGQA